MSTQKFNLGLDIARGIAALGVFLYHIKDTLGDTIPILAKVAQFGNVGVPLFFVISGYVITSSAESTIQRGDSSNVFLKRRFLRIYPPFWISIVVVVFAPYIVAIISSLKSGHLNLPEPLALSYADWVRLITLTNIFNSANGDLQSQFSHVNAVYWTLAIEFQFYLCMYAALLLRKRFQLVLLLTTAISLLILAMPMQLNAGLFLYYWPAFAVGLALFYITKAGFTIEKLFAHGSKIISLTMILSVFAATIFFSYHGLLPHPHKILFPHTSLGVALLFAFLLWLAMPFEAGLAKAKSGKNLVYKYAVNAGVFLGVISYSLYLLHGKISELPAMLARQIVPMNSVLYPALIVAGTVALSYVFYRYAEKPFMSKNLRGLYESALGNSSSGR